MAGRVPTLVDRQLNPVSPGRTRIVEMGLKSGAPSAASVRRRLTRETCATGYHGHNELADRLCAADSTWSGLRDHLVACPSIAAWSPTKAIAASYAAQSKASETEPITHANIPVTYAVA